MFGSQFLEIVVGLVFIYLLLSLLTSTINELVIRFIYSRGKNLEIAIRAMLDDDDKNNISKLFFAHEVFKKLKKPKSDKPPSYISSEYFSGILIDVVMGNLNEKITNEKLVKKIGAMDNHGIQSILTTFLKEADGNIEKFKMNIEDWFDAVMDRATGWYKRKVQVVVFLIGLAIAVIINADTFTIAKKLAEDPKTRSMVVEMAIDYSEYLSQNDSLLNSYSYIDSDSLSTGINYSERITELTGRMDTIINHQLSSVKGILGMGWNKANLQLPKANLQPPDKIDKDDNNGLVKFWFFKLIGWIITALAVSLGAPFWFDILKRVVNIRSTGESPEIRTLKKNRTPPGN